MAPRTKAAESNADLLGKSYPITPEPADIPGSCEVCRFYSPDHKACRRFPQHITKHAHEWCGEFSR